MVEITAEPNRLRQFLKQSLAYDKTPITDVAIIKFSPKVAEVNCQLAADTLVFARYPKEFFIKLNAENDEYFMATTTLVKDRLAYGFKGEKAKLFTDNENVYIQGEGTDDKVSEKLETLNRDKESPFKTQLTEVGLTPMRQKTKGSSEYELMPFSLQALVAVERFTDLPTYEEVEFTYDGKELNLNLKDQLGSRTRQLPIKKIQGSSQPITVLYNMKLLQQLLGQFEGEVWISLNDGLIAISQTYKDYSLTYVLAARTP